MGERWHAHKALEDDGREPWHVIAHPDDGGRTVAVFESMEDAQKCAALPQLLEALELAKRALDLRRQLELRRGSDHATLDPMRVLQAEHAARVAVTPALAAARGEEVGRG